MDSLKIERDGAGLRVRIEGAAREAQGFEQAVSACRRVSLWSCPSGECARVDSCQCERDGEAVVLRLAPRPGETLSAAGDEMNAAQEQVAVIAETGTLGADTIVAPPRLETFETTSARPTGSLSLELHGDPLAARGGGVEGRRLENRRALAFGNGEICIRQDSGRRMPLEQFFRSPTEWPGFAIADWRNQPLIERWIRFEQQPQCFPYIPTGEIYKTLIQRSFNHVAPLTQARVPIPFMHIYKSNIIVAIGRCKTPRA